MTTTLTEQEAAWTPTASLEAHTPEPQQAIITRGGERRLRETLRRLRHQLDVEFPLRLNEARGFGEVGNNDEYLQIREEEGVLASQIARLEQLLQKAQVVDDEGLTRQDTAAIGSGVAVEDLSTGRVSELELAGDYESAGRQTISASSPMGRALIGRRTGSEVEVDLPGGRSRRLRIVSVQPRGSRDAR